MSLAFRSNPNKDLLRAVYDKGVIEVWVKEVGGPLSYLGLPGPEMLDIVEWQELIDRFTAIERSENEQHIMFLRAHVKDVEHRLHSLYGEFDKILLTGRDRYNRAPRWPYQLVNLDYFGGLIYKNLARPRALEKLIRNQSHHTCSFLLIVTQDLRDGDSLNEKLSFFDDLERRLARDMGASGAITAAMAWYKDSGTPDAARQSVYTNVLLRDMGEASHFRVTCRPAITYSGTGNVKMIHFLTEFRYTGRAYAAVSDQSLIDLVNLGFKNLENGAFVEPVQIPRVDL